MNANLMGAEIGQWYAHTDKGKLFQVVGLDEDSGCIEIQYFDGDLDEIYAETWATLRLERIEPPEDVTAPLDDIETGDSGYPKTDMIEGNWEERWEEGTELEDERDLPGEGRVLTIPLDRRSAQVGRWHATAPAHQRDR